MCNNSFITDYTAQVAKLIVYSSFYKTLRCWPSGEDTVRDGSMLARSMHFFVLYSYSFFLQHAVSKHLETRMRRSGIPGIITWQ